MKNKNYNIKRIIIFDLNNEMKNENYMK